MNKNRDREEENGCYVYDFTIWDPTDEKVDTLLEAFGTSCKKWGFQWEEGEETKKQHFQGRVSLNKKKRINEFIVMMKELGMDSLHVSHTSAAGTKAENFFSYTNKAVTRVKGPWRSGQESKFCSHELAKAMAEGMYPWTLKVAEMCTPNPRYIDVLIDKKGNGGKTTCIEYLEYLDKACFLFPLMLAQEMMQQVMHHASTRYNKDGVLCSPPAYAVNFSRAIEPKKMQQVFSAFETIKDGRAYDGRNHWRSMQFQKPALWIFCNFEPPNEWMSADRWRLWTINENKELVEYKKLDE